MFDHGEVSRHENGAAGGEAIETIGTMNRVMIECDGHSQMFCTQYTNMINLEIVWVKQSNIKSATTHGKKTKIQTQ